MTDWLSKIRTRFQKFADLIESADERTKEAKQQTIEAEALAYHHESDRDSMLNRLTLLKKELHEKSTSLDGKAERLGSLVNKSAQEGEAVRELENVESEGDEQMADLEAQLKETEVAIAQTDHRNIELAQKVAQTENELVKATVRCDKAQVKIVQLEGHIAEAGECMKDLQMKDEDASERETVKEDLMLFLESEVKKMQQSVEEEERRVGTLERLKDTIHEEIERWQAKAKVVVAEMADMESLVDFSLSDDEDTNVRPPVPATTPAITEGPEEEPEEEEED